MVPGMLLFLFILFCVITLFWDAQRTKEIVELRKRYAELSAAYRKLRDATTNSDPSE